MEPELFKKVTGLDVKDFELLVSLNVFNEALTNDAVYKFKRYEDASLSYTGVDRHAGEGVGLYSTVVSREDYDQMAGLLTASMEAAAPSADDVPDAPAFVDAPEDDDEDEIKPVPTPKQKGKVRAPIAAAPKTPIPTPTYRPSYVPPAPAAVKNVEMPAVDISDVKAGTTVLHKAFGNGTVSQIDSIYIYVKFDGVEKKFQFPGAFQQGFLKKE